MADLDTPLLVRLEATLSKFEKQMAKARKAGADTAMGIENQFRQSNKRLAQSAEESASAIGKEMDRLRAKYNPLYAASKRYEQELDDLNQAQRLGAITAQEHEAALERLNSEFNRQSAATDGATTRLRGMGGGIQNAAFQIQDFAVQVGAGTSAVQAFAQQAPQLLGSAGAIGAVLGAAVAIGVPLAANFIDLGQNAESSSERIDKLTDSVSALDDALDAAADLEELKERFGEVTAAVLALVDAQERLALVNAANDLREAQETMAAMFELNWVDALTPFGESDPFGKLQDKLELTRVQAFELYDAMQQMKQADGPEAAAAAFANVRDMILDAAGGYDELTEGQAEFLDELNRAEDAARVLARAQGEVEAATENVASAAYRAAAGFRAAIGPVDSLIGKVADLATNAWEYANAMARERQAYNTQVGRGRGADPRQFGGSAEDIQQNDMRAQLAYAPTYTPSVVRSSSGGGGGGGSSSAATVAPFFASSDEQIEALQRQIEMIGKTSAEVAGLTMKHKLLEEAEKRGLDLDAQQIGSGETLRQQIDAQASAFERLTAQQEASAEAASFYKSQQDAFEKGSIQAITRAESASDAMSRLGDVLKEVALRYAEAALQASLFGSGSLGKSSGGGGFLSGLSSMLFGRRATGGPVSAGRPYLINENTPNTELFVPSTNGAVLNVQQAQAALRGSTAASGGGSSTIQIALGEGLVGQILTQAGNQTVQIVQANNAASKSALGGNIQNYSQRGTT